MSKLDELRARHGITTDTAAFTPRVGGFGPARVTPLAQSTLSPLQALRQRHGLSEEEEPENAFAHFVNDLPEPLRRTAGGAIRGLASALEPFQLPQDALFAALAGAIDPETTIAGRFRKMDLSDYMPGGTAPPRISSGEEIFTLMGVDGPAAKWAGIAADLTVDPLVFGAWLRLGGKMTGAADLTKLGDKVDDFISPIGFGREVNRIARRSPTMSRMMDDRMAALERVFRNPNSTVLGIQRFGEKATNALERFALPRGVVDRLRYGRETAEELGTARRTAASMGRKLNEEALEMVWRTQNGAESGMTQEIVKTYIKTLDEQRRAYELRLEALDPTVRDVIEQAVYDAIRPGEEGGIGFLAYLGGRKGIAEVADPDTRILAEETYGALAKTIEGRASVRSGAVDIDELLAGAQATQREILRGHRQRIAAVARERATTAGLGAEEVIQAEAKAVRAFNSYLKDTLLIDAKLGMATSGFDFIAGQLRGRAFELTGSFETGEEVWRRVLAVGLLSGQEGIEALKSKATPISLRSLVDMGKKATQESVGRRTSYRDALSAEVRLLGRDVPQIRRDTFDARMAEIATESKEIWGGLYRRQRVGAMLTPSTEQARLIDEAQGATTAAANALKAAEEGLENARRFGYSGSSQAQYDNRLASFISQRDQAESALEAALKAEAAVLSTARTVSGPMRTVRTAAARNMGSRRVATDRLADLAADATRLETKLRNSRFTRRSVIQEMQGARTRAQAAAGVGPAGRAADDVPGDVAAAERAAIDIGEVPMAGKNTIADDILARRMKQGNMTAEEAAEAPITYGELIDGIMSFQALPFGEFLSGLMNGHLRRAYALFGDTDDFKKYIDNLRVGTIIPSSVIDEAKLIDNMPGYEHEAKLIMDYHKLMVRGQRGLVLKRSSIAEYLLGSQVPPERVNGALRAMMQATGPENGALKDFLNTMDEMIPRYQRMVSERNRALNRSFDDPTVPSGQRYFKELEKLPQQTLERLGEIAMARSSLVESTEIAKRVVSRQEMVQNIYRVANSRGLLKSAPFTDEFGTKFVRYSGSHESLGGFGGKYMHPYLYEELRKATAVKKELIPQAFTRMRALITGGYLAAPSVIAANFFGGLYQAGTIGIDPATMIRRLMQVADDVNAASLGHSSDLVSEVTRNLDIKLSSLSYQDLTKEMNKVRLDDFGLGPQGVNKVFEDVTAVYERFLQRPGIGRVRTRFAGLEGFQFTENWMKVAGYAEMKDRLLKRLGHAPSGTELVTIEKQAAEFARTIVFDYSELPTALDTLKKTGLVLFPGFTYFLAGRTLNAAVNRPGALAVADRISEAFSNATLSLEEQIVAHVSTPEWMRDDQGVPMPFTRRSGASGEDVVSIIPMNQLVPTSTLWDGLTGDMGSGNPWAESVAGLGIFGPFYEVLSALISGEGEAPLTARFGNRVFDADSEGLAKTGNVMRFLYNTLAPSNVKKLITSDMQGHLAGLGPNVAQSFGNMAGFGTTDMMETAYTFEESRTLRPDRGVRENVLATFLRSPQVVALDGPIVGLQREVRNEQARLGEELTMLRRRANRARSEGDEAGFDRWTAEIRRRQDAFNAKWGAYMTFYDRYARRRMEERGTAR